MVCFVVAAASGVAFRYGMAGSSTWGFSLANIRHAHSHLMYFSWATPALFVLLVPDDKWVRLSAWAAMALGVIAFPVFLTYGYRAGTFGPLTMPPAVIVSGMVMLIWYGFVARWITLKRSRALTSAAIAFLVLASFGAWGISASVPLGLENPLWGESFKHIFLGYFTEGWLTIGSIAVLVDRLIDVDDRPAAVHRTALGLIAAGVATSYLLGIPEHFLTAGMMTFARLGAFAAGLGIAIVTIKVWKKANGLWRYPLSALGLKAFALMFLAPLPIIWWADNHQDRVLFLHLMLLGIVSSTIVLASLGSRIRVARPFLAAVTVMVIMLIPVSTLWPFPSFAATWMSLIGVVSLLPILAMLPIIREVSKK